MTEVGGYEQFMNMPVPAIQEVVDYIRFISKRRIK